MNGKFSLSVLMVVVVCVSILFSSQGRGGEVIPKPDFREVENQLKKEVDNLERILDELDRIGRETQEILDPRVGRVQLGDVLYHHELKTLEFDPEDLFSPMSEEKIFRKGNWFAVPSAVDFMIDGNSFIFQVRALTEEERGNWQSGEPVKVSGSGFCRRAALRSAVKSHLKQNGVLIPGENETVFRRILLGSVLEKRVEIREEENFGVSSFQIYLEAEIVPLSLVSKGD